MAKTNVGRPPKPQPVTYVMQIQRWDWSYRLRAAGHIGRMEEYRHLHLFGQLMSPKLPKVTGFEVSLLPDPDFYALREPRKITRSGMMHVQEGSLRVSQSIPADILPSILVGLTSKHFRYVLVDGSVIRYRQGDVVGISLDNVLHEDAYDYPANPLEPVRTSNEARQKAASETKARQEFEELMAAATKRREVRKAASKPQ